MRISIFGFHQTITEICYYWERKYKYLALSFIMPKMPKGHSKKKQIGSHPHQAPLHQYGQKLAVGIGELIPVK